ATSIGLSLPEPNASVHKFNLVPPEILRRAFERKVKHYAFIGAAGVAALLVLFGGWRLYGVHSAEGDVNSLQTSVGQLRGEIPKYNNVVRAVNELRTATGEVKRLSSTAVDWSAVITQIDSVAPAGLGVTAFAGTGGPAGSSTGAAASIIPAGATAAPPGAVGAVNVTVTGTFPNTAHFSPVAEWIDAIAGSAMFSPPGVSAVTNAPAGANTTVTFQSSVAVMAPGSIESNRSH
ncbi:MAG TPA: hypothetical protein VKR22_05820, partial [Acidimicrobiales bacterium]|nr:hypothetical protein [Acidimicrobiales bacterium]